MNKNFDYFKDRNERAKFILKHFEKYIEESSSILDVGCDNNIIKSSLPEKKVVGIDIGGNPDMVIDLDEDGLAVFENDSFDLIICTEVLEHIDNFHYLVDEIFRVSKKYAIISLPNCIDLYTKYNLIFHNKVGKYYGLPLQKIDDRHKWFFSWKEIDLFFDNYCKSHGLKIEEKFLHFNFANSLKGRLFGFIVKIFNLNSASQSYWIIIEK